MKNLYCLVIVLVAMTVVLGCSIMPDYPVYQTDYFYYRVMGNGLDIGELTELGKQQKIIHIPQYIDGEKVQYVGWKKGFSNTVKWESDVLERVYVPCLNSNDTFEDDSFFAYSAAGMKVFLLDGAARYSFTRRTFVASSYDPNLASQKIYTRQQVPGAPLPMSFVYRANVMYSCNYQDAINYGIHYLDDVFDDYIQYIPEDPVREGYTFRGWFKEPECINEWAFDIDLVPDYLSVTLESDGGGTLDYYLLSYRVTYLFAKWEEKEE